MRLDHLQNNPLEKAPLGWQDSRAQGPAKVNSACLGEFLSSNTWKPTQQREEMTAILPRESGSFFFFFLLLQGFEFILLKERHIVFFQTLFLKFDP